MITIGFCDDNLPVTYSTEENEDLCIEEIITVLCKKLKISPVCQHLFGIKYVLNKRKSKTHYDTWLCLSKKLSELTIATNFQFRIRFIPKSLTILKDYDYNSFLYLFYQIRYDFLSGNLPEHVQQPKDALGLVVTDIIHHLIQNTDKDLNDVDIYDFIPKSLKSIPNKFNVKSTTENLFKYNRETYFRKGADFIRSEYLEKVEELGRVCCSESYSVHHDEGGNTFSIELTVDPFHPSYPGVYYKDSKKICHLICNIGELVFLSVRKQDLTVEVSRANGVPCYFTFDTFETLESFVSCLSGYYRLMKTWTFDLCKELPTPLLHYLRSNKCHGPVGKQFAEKKVKLKSNGEDGVGLLRMSSKDYEVYKLTVLFSVKQHPVDYVIVTSDRKVHYKDSEEKHENLLSLIKWTIQTNFKEIGLKRVIPPSDLDRPEQLLLLSTVEKNEPSCINSGPRIMHLDQFRVKNKHPFRGKFSNMYHVQWAGESAEDLAIKVPKLLYNEKSSFLNYLNNFLFVESDCIVKVFGITINPLSLVMEYLPLGPLNSYLSKNSKIMRQVDLVEASSYLAKALWDLNSKGIVHHNIRCHNVLVADHTEQRFKVKLADPGKVEYTWKDVHWLPWEHIDHPSSALTDSHADIWAFGTTIWEIFSLGQSPLVDSNIEEVKALYSKGFMLSKPWLCPKSMYQVMLGCWHPDPNSRKQPQAIMRDVKQIFYNVFNSRRENQYQKVQLTYTNLNTDAAVEDDSVLGELKTLEDDERLSVTTQMTSLTLSDGSVAEVKLEQVVDYPLIPPEIAVPEIRPFDTISIGSTSSKPMTLKELLVPPTWVSSFNDLSKGPPPIELINCSIEILKRIGKGNYGYVFQGKRIFRDGRSEYVALKRLQSIGNAGDFKKEMDIMSQLQHENIVHFHCLAESDQEGSHFQYMVMEYLPLGSLQEYVLANKEDQHLTSDKKLLQFATDIAKGMDYLESQQIIHRDLAARNVLVASEDHVKITDFGLAQKPNQGNYYILRTVREMPIKWYALESIEKGKFSHKTDVWSYGVTLWEIFTRGLTPDLPNNGTQLIQVLKNGTRLVCKSPCKPFIYSKIIRPCWDEEPSMRPEFAKILSIISELYGEVW